MSKSAAYLEALQARRKFIYRDLHAETPSIAVGDLIRSSDNFNFINLVLGVSEVKHIERRASVFPSRLGPIPFVYVRSVRYAYTSSQEFKLLNGQRSRAFKFYLEPYSNKWHVVKEVQFVEISHEENIRRILTEMKDVDTAWKPLPEGAAQEDPTND
jgi:hypothetical protein